MTKFICWWSLSKFLSWKENLKKCTSFEEQEGTEGIIFGKMLILALFSAVLCLQKCLRFLLICFAWEIKGFYQSSLGNEQWGWFQGQNECFPNKISWLNIKISKNWDSFIDDRALITATLISFCHWIGKPLYVGTFLGTIALWCPPFYFDDSSWRNSAKCFSIALTLTLREIIWKCNSTPFCLKKKRPENTFLTLNLNYHKIV